LALAKQSLSITKLMSLSVVPEDVVPEDVVLAWLIHAATGHFAPMTSRLRLRTELIVKKDNFIEEDATHALERNNIHKKMNRMYG